MQIAKCNLQCDSSQFAVSAWPHRWAVVLACATFPLVWVGGLVTTTDSGMAVPDWPNTYGYNLFLYPWRSWLTGPWALFLEHSHRLIGAFVGLVTIALLAVLWRKDNRRWMRWVGVTALMVVVFQGVLGGIRVLRNDQALAMFHGCTGPLFFAFTVAIAVVTSRRWRSHELSPTVPHARQLCALAIVTCILTYLQIVLGAVVRHIPVVTEPNTFAMAVRFHLFLAAILTLHVIGLVWSVLRRARQVRPLGGLAAILGGLLTVQLALGAGTWIVKFAVPSWAPSWVTPSGMAVQQGGWLQTHVITAHVAVGSLLLATSLALALYAVRLLAANVPVPKVTLGKLEAAV
jgi:cytochrome c oxidase assembly protein subunit 15